MVPEDLKYTKEHEWVRDESAGTVVFGVTDYAQDALGDIVYVSLPRPGDTLTAHEACGEIESTKSVSDLYAPVSGRVVRVNEALADAPETINSDPYGEGWMVEVEVAGDIDDLLDAAGYQGVIGGS